jgi:molybdate transport system substrate-binding protein
LWSFKKDVSKGLDLLQNPEINKIAIANPELAPYGKNTVEALKNQDYIPKLKTKSFGQKTSVKSHNLRRQETQM